MPYNALQCIAGEMGRFRGVLRSWGILGGLLAIGLVACQPVSAWEDTEIAQAIYFAEGGAKAKVPYGILSVKVRDEAEARQVCLNTIRNNRVRWQKAGAKGDYLEFLARRYAPVVGATNDPQGLNRNWLRNVRHFLNRTKEA